MSPVSWIGHSLVRSRAPVPLCYGVLIQQEHYSYVVFIVITELGDELQLGQTELLTHCLVPEAALSRHSSSCCAIQIQLLERGTESSIYHGIDRGNGSERGGRGEAC